MNYRVSLSIPFVFNYEAKDVPDAVRQAYEKIKKDLNFSDLITIYVVSITEAY